MTSMPNGVMIAAWLITVLSATNLIAQDRNDQELLHVRETVSRAWFAGHTKTVRELVPSHTIVMSSGEATWKNQADVLRTSAEFHAKGGKLIRLEFPHTEVQHFGNVAIVWSRYIVETETSGKQWLSAGRVTEIFVWQHRHWTNPGWHTESEQ